MITIDQLLESVDLYFEPRWVTKNKDGYIWIFYTRPEMYQQNHWDTRDDKEYFVGNFKLSEFDGKDWTDCIYEVPRKTDEQVEHKDK